MPSDVADASVRFIQNTGQGPIIVKFQMILGGIEVFREELNVVMSQKSELIAITGYLSSEMTPLRV